MVNSVHVTKTAHLNTVAAEGSCQGCPLATEATGQAIESKLFTTPPAVTTGLDARLQQWAAGTAAGVQEQQEQLLQQQQRVVLLDPPAAVRRLQDRQDMLLPLAGRPLILTHNSQQVRAGGLGLRGSRVGVQY